MKKIIAATAMTMLFATGAFAQTADMNARGELDGFASEPGVWDMMMDSEGKDLDDATFKSNWDAASDEQKASLKEACVQAQAGNAQVTAMVTSRCQVASDN